MFPVQKSNTVTINPFKIEFNVLFLSEYESVYFATKKEKVMKFIAM